MMSSFCHFVSLDNSSYKVTFSLCYISLLSEINSEIVVDMVLAFSFIPEKELSYMQ